MTQLRPSQPIPFYALSGSNPEPPKCLLAIIPFTAGSTVWTCDLLSLLQSKRFQSLRTIYYDAMNCANDVEIFFPQTQQRIRIEARHWGYVPVIVSDQMQFQVTGVALDTFRLHLLNVDMDPVDLGASSTIPSSAVQMSASPRLLGRFSPGAGPAEEIVLGAPFSIAGGTFNAQAAAQFNIMGRRTAGAGAYEDSTRTQLNLPGLELANTFSNTNNFAGIVTMTANTTFPLTIQRTDPGALGPFQKLFHDTISPAIADVAAGFNFSTRDTLGAEIGMALFQVVMTNVTAGAFGAYVRLGGSTAGATANRGARFGAGVFSPLVTGGDMGVDSINFITHYANGFLIADSNGLLRRRVLTVATLPSAVGVAGATASVTNSLAPAYLAAIAGGGAAFSNVTSDNAIWVSA